MQKYRAHLPIVILLTSTLLVGILTVRQYGESWDELQFFKYADRALSAYSTWPRTGSIELTGNTYDNYGPAYVMLVALGARFLGLLLPWITSDLRHLLYFVTWLVCIWAFHAFSKRWLSPVGAFGATLLFSTQPLFWGHAFISPKDIPFLTFFLLSLELGFRMVDAVPAIEWEAVSPLARQRLAIVTGAWLLLFLGAYAATPQLQSWIDGQVHAAAMGASNALFYLASDIRRVDPAIYTQRYFVSFLWLRAVLFVGSGVLLLWMWRRVPSALRVALAALPAGILLGVTTSIRVLGPFAGLIVAGYAAWKLGRSSAAVLSIYTLIAVAAMYLSWPYLWPSPIGHLVESVRVMSQYPWKGQVLFDGAEYASTNLPRSYLPVLLGIQLTEPVWLLFAVGLGLLIYQWRRKERGAALLGLTTLWFGLPLVGFVATRSPLYDNFRQVFFILPPVFIAAGVVFDRLRPRWVQAAAMGLLVLPGIVEGAPLHPYEYTYYNSFAGGVHGAFRRFELDYWGTSYREAAEHLNKVADANNSIWVEGPAHLLQLYLRPDLKVYSTYEAERAERYDYVVAITRDNLDLHTVPDGPVIYRVEREGAVLAVIKEP